MKNDGGVPGTGLNRAEVTEPKSEMNNNSKGRKPCHG
jgi:hypothetical protein